VHIALGLPRYEYDPQNVTQLTQEDDHFHGMQLHTIRARVEPPDDTPWESVLPPQLCHQLATEYADINRLAMWQPAVQLTMTAIEPNFKNGRKTQATHTSDQIQFSGLFHEGSLNS
jgi:hypothetical protein